MKIYDKGAASTRGCSFFVLSEKRRENMSMKEEHVKLVGVNFSLYPMSNNFVDIILGSLEKTDTSKVSMETDDVSTMMRGRTVHVFDVTKALVMHAANTGEHVALQATYVFSEVGNDEENDYFKMDNHRMNQYVSGEEEQFAAAKFSLYPLGRESYIDIVFDQMEHIKQHTDVIIKPFATKLEGTIENIFTGLEEVFQATINTGLKHVVMQVTISVNSPSHKS